MNPDNLLVLKKHISNKNKIKMFNSLLNDLEHQFNINSRDEREGWKFWPTGKRLFSPLNPIYLFMINDLSKVANFPFLWVRDGFFTLARFFQTFPRPVNIRTKFIIHKNFSKIVPPSWEKNIWYFDYYIAPRTFYINKPKRKQILLKGRVSQSISSVEYFESEIKKVFNIVKKDKTIELLFYLPLAHEPFTSTSYERSFYHHYAFDIAKLIYSYFGSEAQVKGQINISNLGNPKEITFIDINEKLKSYCDDSENNTLIFNGILPENIIKESMDDNDWYYRLSMNHGVLISDEHPDDSGQYHLDIIKGEKYINSKDHMEHAYFYYLDSFVKHMPDFKWKGSVGSNSENKP